MLLAELGFSVRGVDFSAPMVQRARAEAAAAEVDVEIAVTPLCDPALWGGPIADERYLLIAS